MGNAITTLSIENFKSIQHIELECEAINVFVGRPNVGKSNILEAMALLSGDSVFSPKFYEGTIYYEILDDLFYFRNNDNPIRVSTNHGSSRFAFFPKDKQYGYFSDTNSDLIIDSVLRKYSLADAISLFKEWESSILERTKNFGEKSSYKSMYLAAWMENNGLRLNSIGDIFHSAVRKYSYKRLTAHDNLENAYLLPPAGSNLYTILRNTPRLQDVVRDFFKDYDLQLVFDSYTKKLLIQKFSNGNVDQLPYSLLSDTLQRMIFHLAAIYSNRDSIILFEEPEAHTFAPYQSYLASEIVDDDANQYFIATHSDHVFEELVRQDKRKVAVFVAWYEDHQTKARRLTEEEMNDLLQSHASIFQNIEGYLPSHE